MILQALKEYYDRKGDALPPPGWVSQRIDYALVVDTSGVLKDVQSMEEQRCKERVRFYRQVPSIGKQSLKHTNSGKDANLLWDNSGFALGQGKRGIDKLQCFINTICERLGHLKDNGVHAVLTLLEAGVKDSVVLSMAIEHPVFGEDIRSGRPNIGFRLLNDQALFVFERPNVRQRITEDALAEQSEDSLLGTCLVSGEKKQTIALCHPVIKGVWGTQSAGATIVGINKDKPAFNSYGKEQGANSPVGSISVAAYTKALNYLLDSRQRLQVGDASTVFWAAKPSSLEEQMADIFGDPPKDKPDRQTQAVEALFKSVRSGAYAEDDGPTRFHVLGLSPNAARIAVRFWVVDTVANMAKRIRQHFIDTEIVHGPNAPSHLSLRTLLASIAAQGKIENLPPNVCGDTMRAILEGLPYPQSLLQAAIRRAKAEQAKKDSRTGKPLPNVSYARAALIKACVNRETRRTNANQEEKLAVSMDESNVNVGYRLGRLFATLERIQQDANPGINATIRDRFYSAASSTPVTVFGTLMRLASHLLSKLEKEKPKLAVRRKQALGEIMEAVADFPAHLALADQGRFAIGYYHQMQKFFEKQPVGPTTKENAE